MMPNLSLKIRNDYKNKHYHIKGVRFENAVLYYGNLWSHCVFMVFIKAVCYG